MMSIKEIARIRIILLYIDLLRSNPVLHLPGVEC